MTVGDVCDDMATDAGCKGGEARQLAEEVRSQQDRAFMGVDLARDGGDQTTGAVVGEKGSATLDDLLTLVKKFEAATGHLRRPVLVVADPAVLEGCMDVAKTLGLYVVALGDLEVEVVQATEAIQSLGAAIEGVDAPVQRGVRGWIERGWPGCNSRRRMFDGSSRRARCGRRSPR